MRESEYMRRMNAARLPGTVEALALQFQEFMLVAMDAIPKSKRGTEDGWLSACDMACSRLDDMVRDAKKAAYQRREEKR